MSDVIGSAYIEIRARLDKFTGDIGKGAGAIVAKQAATQAIAIGRSAKLAETAVLASNSRMAASTKDWTKNTVEQNLRLIASGRTTSQKIVDNYTAAGAAATKASKETTVATAVTVNGVKALQITSEAARTASKALGEANNRAAATIQQYGKNSIQAKTAIGQVSSAQQVLQKELQRTSDKVEKIPGGFARGGRAASSAFGVISASSSGALGPMGEVIDRIQAMSGAFTATGKSAGTAFLRVGAGLTGAAAILGTISSKDVGAMNQLKAAVAGTGKEFDENYAKKVEKAVKAGHNLGFSTVDTLKALNLLTISTKDPVKGLAALTTTENIAAARGQSLAAASRVTGMALNGVSRGLKPLGISFVSVQKEQIILDGLNKQHVKTLSTLEKAQLRLKDLNAIDAASSPRRTNNALAGEKASLRVTAAQQSLNKALGKYGPGSDQARMAQLKLNIAHESYSATLVKGGTGVGLSVSKQIALRKATEAVVKAQHDATVSTKTLTDEQKKMAAAGDNVARLAAASHGIDNQAKARINTFTGHLKVLQVKVEATVADIGKKVVPALIVAGPALMGVGAVLETGIIQKTARGVKGLFAMAEEGKKAGALVRVFHGVSGAVGSMVSGIGSAAKGVVGFVREGKIAAMATKVWTGIQMVFNAVMAMNPIGLIIIGIVALVAIIIVAYKNSETFRKIVQSAFKAVGEAATFMWDKVIKPVFKFLADTWFSVVGAIIHGAASAFGWVPGIGGKLKGAAREFDSFRDTVNTALGGVKDKSVKLDVHGDVVTGPSTAPTVPGTTGGGGHKLLSVGGGVHGPGTGTSDSIMARLSHGEHVWTAREVSRAGGHGAMEQMRAVVRGYATGGPVGLNVHASSNGPHMAGAIANFSLDAMRVVVAEAKKTFAAMTAAAAKASSYGPAIGSPGGGVERWRSVVLQALGMLGQSPALVNGVLSLIGSESGGDPNSINLTDSNARAGYPSRGLMQTIPQTFEAYRSQSLIDNIVDPLANVYAGINYALKNYGPGMLAAGGRHTSSGSYLGYARGGKLPPGKIIGVNTLTGQGITLNENGQEYVIPANIVDAAQIAARGRTSSTGGVDLGTLLANNTAAARGVAAPTAAAHKALALIASLTRQSLQIKAAITKDNAQIAQLQGNLQNVSGKTVTGARQRLSIENHIRALRAHDVALKANAHIVDLHAATVKKANATVLSGLAAATAKAKAAKDALAAAVLERVTPLIDAFKGQAAAGIGVADLFNYQPGFGPSSNASVISNLREKLKNLKRFGDLLHQLAKKGASPDILLSLINAGPQAGIAEAIQLLNDPAALTTIMSLQSDITAAGAAMATSIATQVFAPAPAPVTAPAPRPVGAAAGGAAGSANPLFHHNPLGIIDGGPYKGFYVAEAQAMIAGSIVRGFTGVANGLVHVNAASIIDTRGAFYGKYPKQVRGFSSGGLLPAGKIFGVNQTTGEGIVLNEHGRERVLPAGESGGMGNGPLVVVQQMIVRDDTDIQKISIDLHKRISSTTRATGSKRV